MSEKWVFGLTLAVTAAAAAACRAWQRATAFEPDGLLTPGMPATYCLLAVVALAIVAFGLLGRRVAGSRDFAGYLDAFSLPCKGLLALYCAAGAVLVAGGVVGLMGWSGLGLSARLLSLALLPTGLCVALVGWINGDKREARGRFAWPLLAPVCCGCVWLVVLYQRQGNDPTVMRYAFTLLGGLCAAICCYAVTAFSFERPMPLWTLWTGGVAIVLLAAALVDACETGDTAQALVTAGYGLYLMAQAKCLVVNAHRPPELVRWTPPKEDGAAGETEETQEEVESHE